MKFSNEIPEIYYQCREKFGVDWNKGITITYGDTVYSNRPISEDLKVHEEVHVQQQIIMGKDIWWNKYLTDKEFRLSQEVEAYRRQIGYIKMFYNRKTRRMIEKHIVDSMATLYGGMCTKDEARKLVL